MTLKTTEDFDITNIIPMDFAAKVDLTPEEGLRALAKLISARVVAEKESDERCHANHCDDLESTSNETCPSTFQLDECG
jgi:hypothetical protein